ncbi:multidrug resistance-associated protein 1 [Elysia marginata]|uniref:Multidrug resistance-associated protein 1 n=1 Tax=Elysia marginata TaxID=1093978 RepID=A0AAV4GHH3_9GAST|nr:multidrug resistance-associated protein 1 [Elysia marginata]
MAAGLCRSPLWILLFFLVNCERKHGVRSSGYLVIFWFIAICSGVLRLRSDIKYARETNDVPPGIFLHYPCLLFGFILSCFVDDKPKGSTETTEEKPCPEKESSFLSQITFWWFTGMIVQGYKKALTTEDLWSLNKEDKTEYVASKFYKKWNLVKEVPHEGSMFEGDIQEASFVFKEGSAILTPYTPGMDEGKTPKRSLLSALIRTYFWFFLKAAVLKFIYDCMVFVSPQLLRLLIQFTSSDEYLWRGFFYSSVLLFLSVMQSLILHQYFHFTFLLGMRLRSNIISVIYKKTLRLSNSAKRSSTVGEIVNLMSVDAQRFMDLTTYLHMIWSGPFQIGMALYFLWKTLGPSALAGIAVMVLLIPVNGLIAHKARQYQILQMKLKDSRIKLMNEILNGIKVLKLYAWEDSFEKQVLDIRSKELNVLKKSAYLNALTTFFWTCAPFMVSLTTFGVYVLSSPNNILDAEKAFVSLALFNILRFPLSMVPTVVTNLVQANVSLKRLQNFINHREIDPDNIDLLDHGGKDSIKIESGNFSWVDESSTLTNINMQVEEGSLVAVVGAVGSGKSSLLSAILGEMDKTCGSVFVRGSVAYVAQQAWIQNDTLQKNILFNNSLDEQRYQQVVNACALRPDLQLLASGDQTEIGEKGINLSGGQKQRVSLARAVYANSDVYLLDDPLSAVDSHVGKQLFDEVIGPEGMLKGKTRVLVTHGISFLPQVDKIIVLVEGKVSEVGSFKELMTRNGAFADFLRNYLNEELTEDRTGALGEADMQSMREDILSQLGSCTGDAKELQRQVSKISERIRFDSETRGSTTSLSSGVRKRNGNSEVIGNEEKEKLLNGGQSGGKEEKDKLIQAETSETGRVKMAVFMAYIKAVGPVLSVIILIFYVLYNGTSIYANIWLSEWSNDARNPNISRDTSQRDLRLGVYGALGLAQGLTVMMCAFITALAGISASRELFSQFLARLLRNPLSFFERRQTGVILNRCSEDMAELDYVVHFSVRSMLMVVLSALGTAIVMAYATPWILVLFPILTPPYILVQAAGLLHSGLLINILASPMSFFDTTPIGRIVNRFSKDIDTVDVVIPLISGMFLMCLFQTLSTILVISLSTPMFLAVIFPLLFFYYFVQKFYVASSRQLKRLESVSKSPIYSHFGETVTGAVTIRAFKQELRFIKDSENKVDENQICYYPSIVANRWLAIRLEIVGNLIIFFASLFAVMGRDELSPGIVGLSITYAMNVTQTLNWMVRMTCELETNIVAVERIKEYTETPTEAPWIIEHNRPKPSWPERGEIDFKDYKLRYREGLDLVLKGITCNIKSGEKVGIVGRTGAGKSSLTMALFRIIESAGGQIMLDGVDVSSIGLHDLRSKITIIPQDPVLFSGTLRMNLDPFEKYSDEQVWAALEHAHLKSFVSGLAEGLLYECSEGGENLSVGQRQLVCLARALLRKTQLLILDEATAAVDLETDDLIQATIRTEFEGCTVLTIAHRLNTIMDYTRIMVLDAGQIKEFKSPQELLQDTNSIFHSMAKDAGLA